MDSEKIGFFKANKERIREELQKLKEGLEEEKQALAEDRIKLGVFKSELRQREKAIEAMRYEYIKATSGDVRQFAQHVDALHQNNTLGMTIQSSPPAPAARTQVISTVSAI